MLKTDAQLIEEIVAGNIECYKELLDRHEGAVMSILNNRLPYDAVADVAQELFIRSFQSLGNYNGTAPFDHWLRKLTLRACYDYWRSTYRRKEHIVTALTDEQHQWLELCGTEEAISRIDQLAQQQEARELLSIAMNKLKPADRILIDMIYFNHLSMKEAAEALDSNVMLIKVRASRARKKMRIILEQLLND